MVLAVFFILKAYLQIALFFYLVPSLSFLLLLVLLYLKTSFLCVFPIRFSSLSYFSHSAKETLFHHSNINLFLKIFSCPPLPAALQESILFLVYHVFCLFFKRISLIIPFVYNTAGTLYK